MGLKWLNKRSVETYLENNEITQIISHSSSTEFNAEFLHKMWPEITQKKNHSG